MLERSLHHTCFPRLPASLALQFGDGHALCEAMGGSGWGTSPEDEERCLTALAQQGIDTFVMHLQQFQLDEQSLTGWPPSRPCDLSWREVYPHMLRRVRQKAAKLDAFRAPDALVVMPARGAMVGFLPAEARGVNEHDGDELPDVPAARDSLALLQLTDVLHQAGWCFDLTDEQTYEQEVRTNAQNVRLGKRSYPHVLIASGAKTQSVSRATPAQTDWQIADFEGEKKIPSECLRKDERHFLCTFDDVVQSQANDSGNLIASGYGFCQSVTLQKHIELVQDEPGCTLLLTGVDAAAACVELDGACAGYAYGPDWSLRMPALSAGTHALRVRLINSGYNIHGPHHYYLGDYPLVSPMHIRGEKHFGDPPDAPSNTHIPQWHFVNYRLFGPVHLLNRPLREE